MELIQFAEWLQMNEDRWETDSTGETHWVGEGGGASGILPIADSTKNICLAKRGKQADHPGVWGTIGGAIQKGKNPKDSAVTELQEEIGYDGEINLIPAHIYSSGEFRYHNYLGIVPDEFEYAPEEKHAWETLGIEWKSYREWKKEMENGPGAFHKGVLFLFKESKKLIEEIVGEEYE